MKVLKHLLFLILGFLSLFVVVNLFMEKEFKVSRDIEIKAMPYNVFNQVNSLKNWENWDPWLENEPSMKISYNDTAFGMGCSKTWESQMSGNSSMEITNSSFIENIDLDISIDGWNTFKGHFYFESAADGVKVTWVDEGQLPFLLRVMNLFIDKMIGNDLESGLSNLKEYCESIKGTSSDISKGEWTELYTLTITDSCYSQNTSATLGNIYGEIFQLLGSNGLTPGSAPYAQYLQFPIAPGDQNLVVIKAGVLIESEIDVNGRIELGKTIAGSIVSCTNYGAYETVGVTYNVLKEYCAENNLETVQSAYEFYDTDPGLTPDQSKWETRIVYEVK